MGARSMKSALAVIMLISAALVPAAGLTAAAPAAGAATIPRAHPDFNQDGFADVVVSIDRMDVHNAADSGAIEVLYGSPFIPGVVARHQFISNADTRISGSPTDNARFGENWTTGDFNGDGFDDLAVGEFGATVNGFAGTGQVHIFFGGPSGLADTHYQHIDEASSGVGGHQQAGDDFGHSVAAGDLNHDGFSDLIVSAPGKDLNGETQAGCIFVFFGTPTGLHTSGVTAPARRIFHMGPSGSFGTGIPGDAAKHNALFGSPVAVGDFNRDNRLDIAVGEQGNSLDDGITPGPSGGPWVGAGSAIILYGSSNPATVGSTHQFFTEATAGMPGSNVVRSDDRFGAYFASGDYNGDGIQDLAIGADGKNFAQANDAGGVYVLNGTRSGLTTTGSKLISFATRGVLGNPAFGDNFGDNLAAGDFNHDGKVDLAITVDKRDLAPRFPGTDHGIVLIAPGSSSGLNMFAMTSFTAASRGTPGGGPASGDDFGTQVKSADYNHDGFADLYISDAGKAINGLAHAGAVYLYPGTARGLTTAGIKMYTAATPGLGIGAQANAWFGGE